MATSSLTWRTAPQPLRPMKTDKITSLGVKGVIFDVDGTLLDSMKMWNSITFEYAEEKGVYCPPETSHIMNSMSMAQCAEHYINVLGVKGTVEEVTEEIAEMSRDRYRHRVPEVPGAAEFVKQLHLAGVKIALATASDMSALRPALERLGIWPWVDFAVTCQEMGTTKEKPDIFLYCAREFGLEIDECMVAEDALYAAKTAKNAGFRLMGVKESCHPESEIEALRALSDIFVEDFI